MIFFFFYELIRFLPFLKMKFSNNGYDAQTSQKIKHNIHEVDVSNMNKPDSLQKFISGWIKNIITSQKFIHLN